MFKYEKPFMEVVEFEDDVITDSKVTTNGVHEETSFAAAPLETGLDLGPVLKNTVPETINSSEGPIAEQPEAKESSASAG